MLSDGIQNDLTTNGLMKPKTSTNATTAMITYSTRPPFPFIRGPRSHPRRPSDALSFLKKRPTFILEKPYARRRPEGRKRLPLYVLDRDRAEEARVAGVSPVIAHHEDLPLGHTRRTEEAVIVREPGVDVWLHLGLAVHAQHAVLDRDAVSRHGDDALDQVLRIALHALEDHDVAALGLPYTVDELVDEDPVADLQRRDHALRWDPERFEDERPDEAEDQGEGDEEDDQELDEAPALLRRTAALVFL